MSAILPVALTIAGSDSGGGAGIQADLKTFTALGVFGTTAITAITSQNLEGVRSIQAILPEILRDQIEAVCEGFSVAAVKTGMLFSSELIHITAETIRKHKLSRLVVDPVIAATSGSGLIQADAVETLKRELFPLALVITPNLPETEILTGLEIRDQNDMVRALDILCNQFPSAIFVIKGGHLPDQAVDWYGGNGLTPGKLVSPLYAQVNNHGSGCSFASAIAAFLAKDFAAEDALRQAKAFISDALANPLELHGQVRLINHLWSSSKAG